MRIGHDGSRTGLNCHVSDVIKYQGPREQVEACVDVTDHMWQVSFDCLCRKYSVLGARRFGVTKGARALFAPGKPLHVSSTLRQRWRRHAPELELIASLIEDGVPISHWQSHSDVPTIGKQWARLWTD